MYKRVIRTLIVVGVIGYIGYKAYEYFVKKNNEDPEEDFEDFDLDDDLGSSIESSQEESWTDKLKGFAQSLLG